MLTASILVLTVLSGVVVIAFPLEAEDDCQNILSVYSRFHSCIELKNSSLLRLMFKEFLTGPSVVTGDDLLTKMSSVCKAEDVRDAYVNCSTVISSPFCAGLVNIRDYVTRNINERLNLFCDSKQTATWLLEALHNSFIFNIKCLQPNNPVIGIFYNCFSEALKSEDTKGFLELPVDQALPLLQIINRDVFWCAINRANDEFKDNHAKLECGSTWQDIFLGFWVFRTAGDTFGPVIEKPEMEVLKALKSTEGKYDTEG